MARAPALAARLEVAADGFIAVVAAVDDERWNRVARPGEWSIGKEVEHVADGAACHQWIVRLTIGERVSSRRPAIPRREMTTARSPGDAIALIRERTVDGERLLRGLTDGQLDLPTRPARASGQRLETTIERVLIAHYDVHRATIEAKLRNG